MASSNVLYSEIYTTRRFGNGTSSRPQLSLETRTVLRRGHSSLHEDS
jgi:hypothetical protein